jgi:alpha-beta hydrolase superfamily lysophospholipase
MTNNNFFKIKILNMKRKINIIIFLLIFILLPACLQQKQAIINNNMQKISLTTEDQKNIAANFYPATTNDSGVVLVHQMDKSKESYNDLAPKLVAAGFNAIAIDLRGHGESWGDTSKFTDTDYNNMILDVKTAVQFLKSRNPDMKINLIGASIGANIVLQYPDIEKVASIIALSPGINFHEVKPESTVKNNSSVPILLIATDKDTYSRDSVAQFFNDSPLSNDKKEMIIYDGNNHGTNMFTANKELTDKIIEWLKKFN